MGKRDKEYDAFGPWILEINEKHTMPPLFIDYYTQTNTPLLFIKVPRNVDRRDACPGMNLYDYVIAIFNEHMEILHRKNDDSVRVMTIPYTDIKLIKNRHNLLKGTLSLYMKKETIQIDYNTVSEDIIMKMINFIRLGYLSSPIDTFKFTPLSDFSNQLEILYFNLIKEMKTYDPNIDMLAIQPKINLKEESF
ncbi:hypothetical protein [Anaeromicrobium sediminis]|nr:hypothetical protein [Anaeromicrobium sediminis]